MKGVDDIQKRSKLLGELRTAFDDDEEALLRLVPESRRSFKAILKISEKEFEGIEDEIEEERAIMEEKLKGLVDPEEAKRMAKIYRQADDGKPRLIFVFESEREYKKAVKHFGRKKPSVKKLLKLIYECMEAQEREE